MLIFLELFFYILLGIFSGFLAGLFGIGGGVIIIPSFFFIFRWLGFPEEALTQIVLGTSLGVIVFSSLASTYSHHIRKAVVWSIIKIIAPSICVGSALGAITASYIPSSTLQGLVAIFLIAVAVQMALQFPHLIKIQGLIL